MLKPPIFTSIHIIFSSIFESVILAKTGVRNSTFLCCHLWKPPGLWKHVTPSSRTEDMHLQVETKQLPPSSSLSVDVFSEDECSRWFWSSSFFQLVISLTRSTRKLSLSTLAKLWGRLTSNGIHSMSVKLPARVWRLLSPIWGQKTSSTSRFLRPTGTLLIIANLAK